MFFSQQSKLEMGLNQADPKPMGGGKKDPKARVALVICCVALLMCCVMFPMC